MRLLPTAACCLVLLLQTTPAHASEPPPQVDPWAFVDTSNTSTNHDDVTRFQVPGGPARSITAFKQGREINDLSASRDGRRFAYVQADGGDSGCCAETWIRVHAADGHLLRTVDSGPFGYPGWWAYENPRLSPAGSRVLFTIDSQAYGYQIRGFDVATGKVTRLAGSSGLKVLVWLNQKWVLALGSKGPVSVSAAGGDTRWAVAGLTSADSEFAVSPDGRSLAWSRRTGSSDPVTADLFRADLSVADNGVARLSHITRLVTGQDNLSPTWSRDGKRIDFVRATGIGGSTGSPAGFQPRQGTGKRMVVLATGGQPIAYESSLSVRWVVDLRAA